MAKERRRSKLILRDVDPAVQPQSLAIYTLDAAGTVLSTAAVGENGEFDLSAEAAAEASRVVVARAAEGKEEPDLTNAVTFHAFEVSERLQANLAIELGATQIGILFPPFRCAEGTVRHCFPYYLAVKSLAAELQRSAAPKIEEIFAVTPARSVTAMFRPFPIFPRCRPVCDGVVEVYRRTCCCPPIYYLDPRIERLKDRLREVLVDTPRIPRPIPEPDPRQIEEAIVRNGTVDQLQVNAAADLQTLSILPPAEQVAYINVRPYLLHHSCPCGPAQKVGQGFLRPDGTFRICFFETRPRFFCWNTYAFVVKQVINGATVTIYNGPASNNWFSDINDVDLVTYHRRAINCRAPEPSVNPNAVFLQDIGDTPAWRLGKPANGINPAGPYAPVFTDGLINPGGLGGSPANRNLGGTLNLRLFITESLRGTAKYFRLSYVPSANLAADPVFLPPMTWNFVESAGPSVTVLSYALGTRGNLSEIPYWNPARPWLSGQYHGQLDTSGLAAGWFVLILELFDADGNLIPAGINYVNWNSETGTDPVPFAKLLVPLYVDNRSCYAEINNVTAPASTGSDPDCLYLAGGASQQVRFRYKAGFPDPNFLWSYSFWTHRGLTGTDQYLITDRTTNSALPWDNVDSDIGTLLEGHQRCAIAANLHVTAKTTDGSFSLLAQANDQIALSLEQSPWP
jgi:hypothetical protein